MQVAYILIVTSDIFIVLTFINVITDFVGRTSGGHLF